MIMHGLSWIKFYVSLCAGANYRSVWALHKHFPNVKIYVRAHDVTHGLNLEKVSLPVSSADARIGLHPSSCQGWL